LMKFQIEEIPLTKRPEAASLIRVNYNLNLLLADALLTGAVVGF